jgi:Leucine-rich repeat (LRR) protein
MLTELWLYGNPLANPEIISEFGESLETLSISKCNISEIKYLENCTQLQTLVIFDNTIKDISVLRNMTQLYVFLASNNQIENIDVLAYLVDKGAFKKDSKFRNSSNEIGTNINLTGNKIDYQLEKNQKIKAYLNENVAGVKL